MKSERTIYWGLKWHWDWRWGVTEADRRIGVVKAGALKSRRYGLFSINSVELLPIWGSA